MSLLKRFLAMVMVIFMLFSSVPCAFASVIAESDETETYTATVEESLLPSALASNSSTGQILFFGDAAFSGCYGNQLTGFAREIYDSYVDYFVTDKGTGEYTYTFDTPFTFEAEISNGAIVQNEALENVKSIISCSMQTAMDAFLYDYPEVFWLYSIGISYNFSAFPDSNSSSDYLGSISEVVIIPMEIYDGSSAKLASYEAAVTSALDEITVTTSRYDTLKAVHDYICDNAYYNLTGDRYVHSSEPFFIGDGGVVCEGYAKAFKVLCDEIGIPCVLVSGDAGEAHMWNYVQMEDDKWYLVDVTWDDQESGIYYTYFLADSNTIGFNDVTVSQERYENSDFSGTDIFTFTYPELSTTTYGTHVHQWDSKFTVDKEATCTEKGSKSIHCLVEGCTEKKDVTEIPVSDNHSFEKAVTAPTCTSQGYTTYTCHCGYSYVSDYIAEAAHTDADYNLICDFCGEITATLVKSGSMGTDVTYYFYDDGTLLFEGTGEIVVEGDSLPYDSSKVTRAFIGDGITKLGLFLFGLHINLKEITISSDVKVIDFACFYECTALKTVYYNGSKLRYRNLSIDSMYNDSFRTAKKVYKTHADADRNGICDLCSESSVFLSGSCGDNVSFKLYDDGYLEFEGSGKMSSNKGSAWNKYDTLINTVTIGEGITSIDGEAFSDCTSLTAVDLPDTLTEIGKNAFDSCTEITGIDLPDALITIEDSAFYGCVKLSEVEIPQQVKLIGHTAFEHCESITSVAIPDSVTEIGYAAFFGCTKLENISIGGGIEKIGYGVFSETAYSNKAENWIDGLLYIDGCLVDTNLQTKTLKIREDTRLVSGNIIADGFTNVFENIVVDSNNEYFSTDGYALYNTDKTILYMIACADKRRSFIIPDTVEEIADYALIGAHYLQLIVVPESVTKIEGEYNFGLNFTLKDVVFLGHELEPTYLFGAPYIDNDMPVELLDAFYESIHSANSEQYVAVLEEIFEKYYAEYDPINVYHHSDLDISQYIIDRGYLNFIEISVGEHSYTETSTSATCTQKSVTTMTCTCGNTFTYSESDALGHLPAEKYTVDKKSTCTTDGSKSKHCTREGCGEKTDVTVISATGHSYTNSCDTSCNACGEKRSTTHKYDKGVVTTKATCTKNGVKTYTCSVCKATKTEGIAKLGHNYKAMTTVKATPTKNGKIQNVCSVCGYVSSSGAKTIYYPKTIKLSTTAYTYNGNTKTPSVTVKDYEGNTLKKDTDYTVSYESGRKYPGTYAVTINFKGKYEGAKRLYFTIAPKTVTGLKATQTTSTITLSWSKVTGADGYAVYKYNSKKKKYEYYTSVKGTSLKISKLSSGTKYKYKVIAYTKDGSTIYGGYSSALETATSTKTPTLKVSSTKKGAAALTWTNVSGESGYQVYYSTKKSSGYKKLTSTKSAKYSKSKLSSKKTYYFKVRAYTKTDSGTVYSSWSSVKSVKIK